jgi:PAS domain S-box-containing protein
MEFTPEIRGLVFDSLEQASETFFITDAEGVIVYANPAFERLTGCAIADAVGKNARILKSGEHPAEFYAGIRETLAAGKEWSGRLVNRHKDGTKYVAAARISPVKNGGSGRHSLAVMHDITGEAALQEKLLESRKMEALGLLAGQLSHDFNNVLTIIIGSMELVMEDIPPNSVVMKLAQGILQASKNSAELIKQLLIFSGRRDSTPEIVDLNKTISGIREQLDRLPGPGTIEYILAPGLALVDIEAEQFKQALTNIVLNAKEAMPSGGKITITTHNRAVPTGCPSGIAAGEYAVVEVSDTGPGISREAVGHLFEPFFTTKPKSKGAGLGLSVVYGIIKQHNGEILAGSGISQGAVFKIYLPKAI